MALSKGQIEELVKVIKLHVDWAVVSLLGSKAVTDQDLQALKQWGQLPTDVDASLVENTFVLGILKAVLKKAEWKKLSFEQLLEEAKKTHTALEELAIQQAELNAAQHIKGLFDDIAAGVYDALADTQSEIITEAYIKDIVKERTKLALLERTSYQKLASDLAHTLETDWSRDWRRVAETELQRAKVAGHAHAIASKYDVYQDSDGLDSQVSVVPAPDACEDCKHHYLDKSGQPKIFTLKTLMSAGSNGEEGVKHTRKNGLHAFWKTTLPPLHPRCGCNVTYVPPGFGWKDGKLAVVDKKAFKEHLSKADKEYSPFSPTAAPMGPATVKPPSAPKPPNLPGLPTPGHTPGPGAPSMKPQGQSANDRLEPCPFGGGQECEKHGGDGAEFHKPGYEHPLAGPEGIVQEQQIDPVQAKLAAKQFAKTPKHHSEIMDHLLKGDFATKERLGAEGSDTPAAGINEAYKVAIEGNGNALYKPITPQVPGSHIPRFGVVPHGQDHKHEEAAYKAHVLLGMADLCPPTTARQHEGKIGSIQAWSENAQPVFKEVPTPDEHIKKDKKFNHLAALVKEHPHLKEQFAKQTAMDIVMNNTDRHMANFLIKTGEDGTKSLVSIDHGLSFGNGLNGLRAMPLHRLADAGHKLKLDDGTLDHFKSLTFGDFKRSMGEHLQPWQVAQSYMRMKYLVKCHEEDGHIDPMRFVHLLETASGMGADDPEAWKKQVYSKKSDTNQMFQEFMSDFLEEERQSGDPARKAIADEIIDTGPFLKIQDIATGGGYQTVRESLKDGDKDADPQKGTAPAWKKPVTKENPMGSAGVPFAEHVSEKATVAPPSKGGYSDKATAPAKNMEKPPEDGTVPQGRRRK